MLYAKIDTPDTILTKAKAIEIAAINNAYAEADEVHEVYRVEPKFHGFVVALYEDDEFIGNL